MPEHVDLHIHSSFSDGTLSPQQIVEKACKLELKAIALTDHDTTAGLRQFLSQKCVGGLQIVPGVELSAHHHLASVHVLGYGIDPENDALQKKLKKIQAARQIRNKAIIQKLRNLGFPLSLSEIDGVSEGQIGRPHIAHLMVQKGIVGNEDEAFSRFLKKHRKCYVERELLPVEEAIRVINQAGGVAALAHPASVDPTCSFLYNLIEDLCAMGLSALEVYHPVHNKKHIAFLGRVCRELDLVVTGGSDFHGRDGTMIGRLAPNKAIPREAFTGLERILADRKRSKRGL
jgi:hypothetical protein